MIAPMLAWDCYLPSGYNKQALCCYVKLGQADGCLGFRFTASELEMVELEMVELEMVGIYGKAVLGGVGYRSSFSVLVGSRLPGPRRVHSSTASF